MVDDPIEHFKYLIADKLDMTRDPGRIVPDAPLLEAGLKLDSLTLVELITLTEEKFGIELGQDDLNMDALANPHALAAAISTIQSRSREEVVA